MGRTVVVLAALLLVACGSSSSHRSAAVAGGCGLTTLHRGSGPAWDARSNPPTGLPYAAGARGTAAAFIFGYPLRAGNPTNRANKILWIVRMPGSGLTIRATPLHATSPTVTVKANDSAGPEIYPSYVNVPKAGCWHMTISWASHTDSVDLNYAPSHAADPQAAGGKQSPGVPSRCPHKPVDPRAALPLTADALAPATRAALRYYESRRNDISGFYEGAIAELATRQRPPDRSTARYLCGAPIANRTVLVKVTFPKAKPTHSASLSFGVVLVSRFTGNHYRVWFLVH